MQQQRLQKIVIFNSCLILVVGLFSMDMYNPSLPSMVAALGISQATAKGLAVAYLCGFGISQLFYGSLSDYYGRKPVILISILLAVCGNLLTSFASHGWELLLYRLITGIGAGGCPVISRAILRDTFSTKKSLANAFSIFAMSSQLSPGIAPVLGGVIQEHFSWRMNFVALSLITFAVFLILIISLPETHGKTSEKINMKSIRNYYFSLFRAHEFMLYGIISAVVFAYTIGYFTISPFVFQQEFGLSPSLNGLLYVFYSLGIVLGSYSNKKFLLKKFRQESLVLYCSLIMVIASCGLYIVGNVASSLYAFLIITSLIAISCGISAPLLISLAILKFEKMAGAASAVQGTIKMLGTAITLFLLRSEEHT